MQEKLHPNSFQECNIFRGQKLVHVRFQTIKLQDGSEMTQNVRLLSDLGQEIHFQVRQERVGPGKVL